MKIKRIISVVEYEGREWSRIEKDGVLYWEVSVHGLQYRFSKDNWQYTYGLGEVWLNCTHTPIIEKEYQRKINESN